MFGIAPTPFDVRLVAFRIPIRVHPTFWLGSILFAGNQTGNLPASQIIFIWVVCSFVSILVHELGHAFTAEFFGWPTEIVMYFGGGLAISQRYRNDTAWRSIAVSFMGPAAGFMLYGLVVGIELALNRGHIWENEYRSFLFRFLKFMNLYWGLLNLLPVLPLDGGHILHSLCEVMRFRDATGIALKIGAVVSGAAAYYFFVKTRQSYAGMLMLMLCLQNVGALQPQKGR